MIRPDRTPSVVLLVACVALSCTIAAEWVDRPRDRPPPPNRARVDTAGDPVSPETRPDVGVLVRQLVERPLFAPNRRPAVEASGNDVPSLPRLSGIILDGSRQVAIFADPDGSGSRAAEPGQDVGGYGVVGIVDGAVTIAGPKGARVLRPAFGKFVPKPEAPLPLGPPALLELNAKRPH